MCLGIPAKVIEIVDVERCTVRVEVSGVARDVSALCVAPSDEPLETLVGSWVLLHVGFAMSVIDEAEAAKTLELLEQLGEVRQELATMRDSALP